MTIRRQLVNFGKTCTDFRIGSGALEDLPRLIKSIAGEPKRALLVHDALPSEENLECVRRALVDTGYSVEFMSLARVPSIASIDTAQRVFATMESRHITADDLLVAVGGVEVCSVVSFCTRTWCSGTSALAIPFTLDAMCTISTSMRALDAGSSREMISIQPGWDMIVCDIDLIVGKVIDQVGMGYALLLSSAFAQSRRIWDQFAEKIDGIVDGAEIPLIDALCNTQTARASAVRSANPSARNAVNYGVTTMHALRACLGDDVPDYLLYAEGLRFEARLAHDACGLDVDLVFEQDDRLDDLGIEELPFKLDVDRFIAALHDARFVRSNRFMLSLPKNPGSIRLSKVDEDILRRHAEAYLASRTELLEEEEDAE